MPSDSLYLFLPGHFIGLELNLFCFEMTKSTLKVIGFPMLDAVNFPR